MELDWMQLSRAFDRRSLSVKVSRKGRLCRHRWSEVGSVHSLSSPIWKSQKLMTEAEVNITSLQSEATDANLRERHGYKTFLHTNSHWKKSLLRGSESSGKLLWAALLPDILRCHYSRARPSVWALGDGVLPDDAFQARFFWHRIWKICKCQCVPSQK